MDRRWLGRTNSVPPENKIRSLKKWPAFVLKQIRFKHKNRHHHPAFEETGNVAKKNSTSTLANKISSDVKTTEQSLRGNIHTSRSLADYLLKSELLFHASGEPENEANKRTHVLIIA